LLGTRRAEAVLADKGYDADAIVEHVEAMGAKVVIPPKRNRKLQREYDITLYKQRNRIDAASANSSAFADSPRDTKNQKPASKLSSPSPAHGCT